MRLKACLARITVLEAQLRIVLIVVDLPRGVLQRQVFNFLAHRQISTPLVKQYSERHLSPVILYSFVQRDQASLMLELPSIDSDLSMRVLHPV